MQVSSLFTPEAQRGPHVRTVPVMDPYRDRAGRSDEELATAYADEVKRAIDSFAAAGMRFAGLLFCTAFSSEGLPTVPAGFMAKALAHVHAAGGFFIADEVQAGFGRLGSHMWGHQKLGVVPDIVTLGKPMGNGHPLAGVVARRDLINAFTGPQHVFQHLRRQPGLGRRRHRPCSMCSRTSTCSRMPLHVGRYTLEQARNSSRERHTLIGDVRGAGLFFAVELVSDRDTKTPATAQTKRLVNMMRERGVLISRIGIHDNILKIRPPMLFSQATCGSARRYTRSGPGGTVSGEFRSRVGGLPRRDAALALRALAPLGSRRHEPRARSRCAKTPCSGSIWQGGGRAVLRVHRAAITPTRELDSEFIWLRALEAAGIAVPRVIRSRRGRDFEVDRATGASGGTRQIDVFEWIDGRQLGSVESGVGGRRCRHCRAVPHDRRHRGAHAQPYRRAGSTRRNSGVTPGTPRGSWASSRSGAGFGSSRR